MKSPCRLGSLSTFPTLKPISGRDLTQLREFAQQFEPYSDFDAISLWSWSWSNEMPFRVANLMGNLVVEFSDYLTGERFLSFLGTNSVDECASILTQHASVSGMSSELQLVPGIVASALDPNLWDVQEQEDDHDYVYEISALASLTGRRLKAIRGKCNRFERLWGSRTRVDWMDMATLSGHRAEVLDLFDDWRRRGSGGATQSDSERNALSRLLSSPDAFQPEGPALSGLLYVEDELVAAWIAEVPQPKWMMWHFMKMASSEAARDVDPWLTSSLCRRANEHGVVMLNSQQDLGIPELRAAKAKLRPIRQLKKFRVRGVPR